MHLPTWDLVFLVLAVGALATYAKYWISSKKKVEEIEIQIDEQPLEEFDDDSPTLKMVRNFEPPSNDNSSPQ